MKKRKILFYALIAAFGAFVVGLNLGGISGAIDLIEKELSLSALAKGFVASALMVGCLFGALTGGSLSDKYGRKPMLFVSAIILLIAAAGQSLLSPSLVSLVVSRLVGGLGVGVLSAVIPTYISEISPANLRGTFVSFYQVFVVIGIMIAYTANYFFFQMPNNWRLMLGLPLIFAVIDIILLSFVPESPLWLSQKGNKVEKSVKLSELFKGKTAKIVLLGSLLAFFQQITGINVVISYAPSILGKIGIAGNDPLLQTIFVGAANLVFTLIALWMCDKFGRKTLLVSGCVGLVLSLSYLAYAFGSGNPDGIGVLVAILAYIAFFALSLSPLMFVVTAEIYPSHIRGTAMALSTGISWACAFLVVQFFPLLEASIGSAWVFAIFAALSLAAGLFIKFCIPETKGKTLEEIQQYFD